MTRSFPSLLMSAALALLAAPAFAQTETQAEAATGPDGAAVCAKMIGDGRTSGLDQSQCECRYEMAAEVLDPAVSTLLFDSWYNGTNNSDAINALPEQRNIKRQFRTMHNEIKRLCK